MPVAMPATPRHALQIGINAMNTYTLVAVALIVVGILGLVYGQFSYTKDSETAKLGPVELTVEKKETVNVPVWAGVASIAAGTGILLIALIKR